LKFVTLAELGKANRKLAETLLPVRMTIVEAAFPYRQQMEEFRKALRFASVADMLADDEARPEFLGLMVQRRTLYPNGKVADDWKDLDLDTPLKNIRVHAVATVPEDPELEQYRIIVRPNRLVMPRPMLARERDDKYPDSRLESIQNTIDAMEKTTNKGEIMLEADEPPSRFKDVDIYEDDPGGMAGPAGAKPPPGGGALVPGKVGGGATGGPPGFPGGRPTGGLPSGKGGTPFGGAAPPGRGGLFPGKVGGGRPPAPGGIPPGPAGQTPTEDDFLPEMCLVRFIDVTIQPGFRYEYRIKVKMANPNYQREDRAVLLAYTKEKELVSDEWKVVSSRSPNGEKPIQVRVPAEVLFYAFDDASERKPGTFQPANDQRAAVQIHRWLDFARADPNKPETEEPVGDWSIADRLLVHRGEYVGRFKEVAVPYWRSVLEEFILMVHPEDKARKGQAQPRRHEGVALDFNTGAILVDFEGAGKRDYLVGAKKVNDDEPVEMLILSNEGRLVVHEGKIDAKDEERKTRYERWKSWTDQVRRKGDDIKDARDDLFEKGKKK
jgi:hypothetical protein